MKPVENCLYALLDRILHAFKSTCSRVGLTGTRNEGKLRLRFWERYSLEDLSQDEWEALCDGCGLCCLLKFQDDIDADVTYTNVACRLFDCDTCRCSHYNARAKIVPDCAVLTPETLPEVVEWMPSTCAYLLRYRGQPLADWHPLVSGRPESVHEAGISVRGRCIPEYEIDMDDLEEYAVRS